MSPLSEPTGAPTGLATSTNVAYGMMKREKEMERISEYELVDQSRHHPVEPSQFQGEEGGYVIPNLPEQRPTAPATVSPPAVGSSQDREKGYANLLNSPPATAPAVSPPAVAPCQDRKGGTQEEAVYEPIPGD